MDYTVELVEPQCGYHSADMPAEAVRVLDVGYIGSADGEVVITIQQITGPSGEPKYRWSFCVEHPEMDHEVRSERAFPALSQAIDDGTRALAWLDGMQALVV